MPDLFELDVELRWRGKGGTGSLITQRLHR